MNMGDDFQLILSKDPRKRTKNVHSYMQFYFIEIKTKSVSWDFYEYIVGVTIPSALTNAGMVQFTTTIASDNLKKTDVYNSHAKICRSVIVQRAKYQELWKGLYLNCCDLFYTEDFVGRSGIMLSSTPLRSPDIFYNHASRSQKG